MYTLSFTWNLLDFDELFWWYFEDSNSWDQIVRIGLPRINYACDLLSGWHKTCNPCTASFTGISSMFFLIDVLNVLTKYTAKPLEAGWKCFVVIWHIPTFKRNCSNFSELSCEPLSLTVVFVRCLPYFLRKSENSIKNENKLFIIMSNKIKMSFIWKDDFFVKIVKSNVAIYYCSTVYTTIFVRRKDKTCLSNQTWAKCYHSRNKRYVKKNVRWRSLYFRKTLYFVRPYIFKSPWSSR